MLTKVTIENFKAFGKETVIDIAPITLLFGKNSTGKSTVLHAIGLVDDVSRKLLKIESSPFSISDRAWDEVTYRQLVHNHDISSLIRIRLDFQVGPKLLKLELAWLDIDGRSADSPFEQNKLPPGPFELRFYEADSENPQNTIRCQLDLPAPKVPSRYVDFITAELSRFAHAPSHRELRRGKDKGETVNVGNDPGVFRRKAPAPGSTLLHAMWDEINTIGSLGSINKALETIDKRYQLDERLYVADVDWNKESPNWLPLQCVGSGISQILPVLHLCTARKGSNIFLQQPEEEMHPAGQCMIAEVLAKSANENGNRLLVETHSEHILRRILSLIRDKKIDFLEYNEKVRVYSIENGVPNPLTVERDGTFRVVGWPKGFFEERYSEIGGN